MQQIDTDIFLALNGLHSPWLDNFMWFYTGKWVWAFLYAAILLAMVYRWGWRRAAGMLLVVALIIVVCDQLCGHVVRNSIMRLRPANPDNPISPLVHIVNGYRGGPYGFPSCHAANTFGLAVFVSLLFRRGIITVAMLLWAVVTCWSRVTLGVHYPGDLLVGALTGTLVAVAAYYSSRAIYRRYPRRPPMPGPVPSVLIVSTLVITVSAMALTALFA